MGDDLRQSDRQRPVLELAFAYLAGRDRSVAEMRHHLQARGVGAAGVERAIGELRAEDYLNDERFARQLVADRRTLASWGTHRLRRALTAAGIARDLADAALAPVTPGSELATACELLRQRFPDARSDPSTRRRALALLARRGYDLELAYEAVRAHERREAEHAPGGRRGDGHGAA